VAEEPVAAPVQPETVAPVLVVEPEPTPAEALEPEPAPVAPSQEAEEPPPAQRPERVIPLRSPQPIEPELVLIPAGEFLMGSDPAQDGRAYDAEQPQHGVYLPAYHIGRTPVTNAQYAAFVEATGHKVPKGWVDGKPREGKEDFPVVYVSWRDAMAYCEWLSEKSGQACRLPSEAEWEKAARGTDGEIYPWGNVWEPDRCNSTESGPDDATLVIAHPKGASPYGILDMAGNVWEWTGSLYRPYPYDPNDGREDPKRLDGERALRGGAYYSSARRVRCAYRDSGDVDDWRGNYGFRVCVPSRAVSPPAST
jgi:formylglycine-generating enzyme required for sulfatase activity